MSIVQSTITSKGQVTIPKEVRDRLRLSPGDRITWDLADDGAQVRKATEHQLEELVGMLGPAQRSLSVEEIDDLLAEDLKREWSRQGG